MNGDSTTIHALPRESLLKIFTYLDGESLGVAGNVCKYWKGTAEIELLWKDLCQTRLAQFSLPPSLNWRQHFIINFPGMNISQANCSRNDEIISAWSKVIVIWKKIYPGNCYHMLTTETDHTAAITCFAVQYVGISTLIFTTSADDTVKIWSKGKIGDHFALAYTFKHAEGPITAIIASGDAFICGNSKGTLLAWEAVKRRFTYELREPINAHKGKITHIRAAHTGIKDTFFSCSLDKTIKIWSLRKEKLVLLQTLDEDFGRITALEIPKGTEELFAGYADGKVRRWRNDGPLGYKLISTIQAHHKSVKSLDFSKYASQMVSSDGIEIKLWSSCAEKDHKEFELLSVFPADSEISCVRGFVEERQNAIKHLYCFSENHFTCLTNVHLDGPVLRSKVPIMATNPVQQRVHISCMPLLPTNARSKSVTISEL